MSRATTGIILNTMILLGAICSMIISYNFLKIVWYSNYNGTYTIAMSSKWVSDVEIVACMFVIFIGLVTTIATLSIAFDGRSMKRIVKNATRNVRKD